MQTEALISNQVPYLHYLEQSSLMVNGNTTTASEGCYPVILFTMHLIMQCIWVHWLMKSTYGHMMDIIVPTQHQHMNGWGGHHGECHIDTDLATEMCSGMCCVY